MAIAKQKKLQLKVQRLQRRLAEDAIKIAALQEKLDEAHQMADAREQQLVDTQNELFVERAMKGDYEPMFTTQGRQKDVTADFIWGAIDRVREEHAKQAEQEGEEGEEA